MRHVRLAGVPRIRTVNLSGITLLLLYSLGCGTNTTSSTPPDAPVPPVQGPQTYFAPYIAGTTNVAANNPLTGPKIYAIDDSAGTFSQSTFQLQPPQQQGPQVINQGVVASVRSGLLSLGITTNYTPSGNAYTPTTVNPLKLGSFVELAGQAGGFVQLVGQPVSPLVAATQCPNSKTAQTYQFMTIPAGLINSVPPRLAAAWNPATDTAYGSVDISSDGSNIKLDNIHQYTLSSGGTGAPVQQPSSPVTGACGPTVLGSTITLGQLTVTDPNPGNGQSTPPQASVGIGPTGLLVEGNGAGDASVAFPGTSPSLFYDNTLGAGTGAVGLPMPSNALDAGALLHAQYSGFVYGAGVYSGTPCRSAQWLVLTCRILRVFQSTFELRFDPCCEQHADLWWGLYQRCPRELIEWIRELRSRPRSGGAR